MPADVKIITAFAVFVHDGLFAEVVAVADQQAQCFACWQNHVPAVDFCPLAGLPCLRYPIHSTFSGLTPYMVTVVQAEC